MALQIKLKEQFGQLTLADVTLQFGKDDEMLARIGNRLSKSLPEVINILMKLKYF